MLGIVGFAGQIRHSARAYRGSHGDRWIGTDVGRNSCTWMVQSLAIGFSPDGLIEVWHGIALSIFQGVINAFDMRARQSFVLEMVATARPAKRDRAELLDGKLGPAPGPIDRRSDNRYGRRSMCFIIDASVYIAVIAQLLAMNVIRRDVLPRKNGGVLEQLIEGGNI